MMNIDLKKIIEALLFSSDKPLSLKQIKDIINNRENMADPEEIMCFPLLSHYGHLDSA